MVEVFLIQLWQFFTGLVIFIITIVGAAVTITRYVTRFEGNINLLQERINTLNRDLDRERNTLNRDLDREREKISFLQNYFLDLGLRTTKGRED